MVHGVRSFIHHCGNSVEGSYYTVARKQRNNELAFSIVAYLMYGVPSCRMKCSTLRACSCPWVHPLLNHPHKTHPELGFLNLLVFLHPICWKPRVLDYCLSFIYFLFFDYFSFILLLFSCRLCHLRLSCLGLIFKDRFHDCVAFISFVA